MLALWVFTGKRMGVSLQSFKAELFHKLMMKKSSTQLQSSNNNVGLSSIEEQLPLEQTSASSNDSLTPAFSIEEKNHNYCFVDTSIKGHFS